MGSRVTVSKLVWYYTLSFVLASAWKSAQTIAFRGINNHLMLAITSWRPSSPATMSRCYCLTWLACRCCMIFLCQCCRAYAISLLALSAKFNVHVWIHHLAWQLNAHKVKVSLHVRMTFTDSAVHLPSSGWIRIVTFTLKVWLDGVVLKHGWCLREEAKQDNPNEIWDVGVWEGEKKGTS